MRCGGSGQRQMLAWDPDPEDGYPGAVVCAVCSKGVVVMKGTVRKDGEGLSGTLKRHQEGTS